MFNCGHQYQISDTDINIKFNAPADSAPTEDSEQRLEKSETFHFLSWNCIHVAFCLKCCTWSIRMEIYSFHVCTTSYVGPSGLRDAGNAARKLLAVTFCHIYPLRTETYTIASDQSPRSSAAEELSMINLLFTY